ncbi:MAG: hypothetical protein SWY16_00410 [Cyanobacteriota bacterium]|nr:hypothetical protein [Cyanobacteriota bacterium]
MYLKILFDRERGARECSLLILSRSAIEQIRETVFRLDSIFFEQSDRSAILGWHFNSVFEMTISDDCNCQKWIGNVLLNTIFIAI